MKVTAVPQSGMVTKVGMKVPMMLPMVCSASSSPTIRPLFSRLRTAYLISDGVIIPRMRHGPTNRRRQEASDAQIRKFDLIKRANRKLIPAITYFETKGITPIQIASISSRT